MWLIYKINSTEKISSPENARRSGGVWGASVHGMVPVSITAVHCALTIQCSLPHWNGGNIERLVSSDLHSSQSAHQCHLSQLKEVVYSETVLQSRAHTMPRPSREERPMLGVGPQALNFWGFCSPSAEAEIDAVRDGETEASRRSTMAGNFEPSALTATCLLLSNT